MKSIVASAQRWFWKYKWWVAGSFVALVVLAMMPVVVMRVSTDGKRFAAGDPQVPEHRVAVVFGAGVQPDGEPTPYLQRRLDSAVDLYKAGKAEILLLSGDNSASHYNEPEAMQRYVVSQGVDKDDTVTDFAGFNTYDSCYRAKAVFGVEEAILVSQAYHLPRAIWTCDRLGVRSIGVAAKLAEGSDGRDYTINYLLREVASSSKAMLQTTFKPKPAVLGEFQPIEGSYDR